MNKYIGKQLLVNKLTEQLLREWTKNWINSSASILVNIANERIVKQSRNSCWASYLIGQKIKQKMAVDRVIISCFDVDAV